MPVAETLFILDFELTAAFRNWLLFPIFWNITGVLREEAIMSDPRPPYYFKTTGVTYHWETECSENDYPETDWQKNSFQPYGRKQCEECKQK